MDSVEGCLPAPFYPGASAGGGRKGTQNSLPFTQHLHQPQTAKIAQRCVHAAGRAAVTISFSQLRPREVVTFQGSHSKMWGSQVSHLLLWGVSQPLMSALH